MSQSPSSAETVCGLDIGSNTFSFTEIAKIHDDIVFISDGSYGVRLSEGLHPGGALRPEAVKRGLDTLGEIIRLFDLDRKRVRAVATAVLRNTIDPSPFLVPAEALLGHPIEIIDGREEARLTLEGATFGLPKNTGWLVLDIGGQSTELSWQTAEGRWESVSLDMGVVGLTETFLPHDPPTPDELMVLRRVIKDVLDRQVPRDLKGALLAVAGTASSLGMLHQSLSVWRRELLHGAVMDEDALTYWMDIMAGIPSEERQKVYGVRPVRADVFPAGIAVIQEVMRYWGLPTFTISATGLRLGAALSLL